MREYTKQNAITLLLLCKPVRKLGAVHSSGFCAALKDARAATKRDPEDGGKLPGEKHGSWLGALGYMVLLDQIGKCFRPQSKHAIQGSAIHKALTYFTTLGNAEMDALYALRCAFAHDYSLINVNREKPGLTHRFHIWDGPSGSVVTLPKVRWDGNLKTKSAENVTSVNLEQLGDLVENIFRTLMSLAQAKKLELDLRGGPDELMHRYVQISSG
jgi:hypothetical protein